MNDNDSKLTWWGKLTIGLICAAIIWATWALAAGSMIVIVFLILMCGIYGIFEWKWSPNHKHRRKDLTHVRQ